MVVHSAINSQRLRQSLLVFRACLGYTLFLTTIWFFLFFTGIDGGLFFGQSQLSASKILGFVSFFAFFWMVWSYGFYWIKYGLLKRAGLSRDELRLVFSSRLNGFHLESFLENHSEKQIRIIDMIGRRGRMLVFVVVGFAFIFLSVKNEPTKESLLFGLQSSLLDALLMNWWILLTFRSNGVLGNMAYGAQARILDGVQGRANALLIGTLWSAFKFVMIPIGLRLADVYPPETYAVIYAFIWLDYAVTDFASEIFGSIWGRHGIRVWGIGDMNKKSWAGVVSGFVLTLAMNLCIVWSMQLSLAWCVLGLLLAVLNPLVELFSPRGTDDFTMATINALVCLGYGYLFIGV
jgi:hypothetical protein